MSLTSGVRSRGRGVPRIVVGNVDGQAAKGARRAGLFVHVGEECRCRIDVGGPAKPPCVSGIEVHGHVGKIELANGILSTLVVGGLGTAALGDVHVGDHVGQGVGFW